MSAQKSRGQNFLADANQAAAIVRSTGLDGGCPVLEIGPGLGALTVPLLQAGALVTAVEIDHGLADYLEEEIRPQYQDQLVVVRDDILKFDLSGLIQKHSGKIYVVGNLPYLISTPIILRLLEARSGIRKATLMFQTELAERLSAAPGSRDYGRLSVLLGYFSRIRRVMTIGPESFFPRPKVGSTVIEVVFREKPEPPLVSEDLFSRVIAAAFSQRRKTLKNSLRTSYPQAVVDQALDTAGIDPGRRAESLSVEEFVRLTNVWPGGR